MSHDIKDILPLQPEGWQDIRPFFTAYSKSSFCFPIKVCLKKRIVGLGVAIKHDDVVWLAHIIVHPEYRKKGIGKHITAHLLQFSQQINCSRIYLIATALGAPVYKKVGFTTETAYLFYKNIHINNHTPHQNIIPFTDAMLKEVAALDYQISGEKRITHLKMHLKNAVVFKKQDKIEGIYLPNFGEGLILAHSKLAGLALMKLRFQTHSEAVFPAENSVAIAFLRQHNLEPHSSAKRMLYGTKKNVQFQYIYNRIGGNLG